MLLRRWDDPEWIKLSHTAQWLYDALVSSSKLSAVGVVEWRPRQFAKLSGAMNLDLLEAAFAELRQGLYVVYDEEVELVLIRSYLRNDDVVMNTNMMVAAVKAWRQIGSIDLKQVVVNELSRLKVDFPTSKAWEHADVIQTFKTGGIEAREYVAKTWPEYVDMTGEGPIF